MTKGRAIPGTGCDDAIPPEPTPVILSAIMPCTLLLFAASIPQEANEVEAKRHIMTMNLITAVKNFQRLMHMQVLL